MQYLAVFKALFKRCAYCRVPGADCKLQAESYLILARAAVHSSESFCHVIHLSYMTITVDLYTVYIPCAMCT